MVAGIALGAWLSGGNPAEAQAAPAARFQIVDTEMGNFVLNTSTGDTWKWWADREAERMGWQYFVLPVRIHGCSTDSPECRP